jgi:hypothetical protein
LGIERAENEKFQLSLGGNATRTRLLATILYPSRVREINLCEWVIEFKECAIFMAWSPFLAWSHYLLWDFFCLADNKITRWESSIDGVEGL